jgi:CBS domain-containing protein
MKNIKVKDLMVPLAEYATVSEDATLYEAILALEESMEKFTQRLYKYRAILVLDKNNRVVGKLSQLDVLRGLEPKYAKIGDMKALSRFGFSRDFIKSMLVNYDLWQKPLEDICKKAAQLKVKDIMYTPSEGEYVEEDATLDQAIHQLVLGHHQSLLVTRKKEIIGIFRLSDLFKEIWDQVKACAV